MLKILIAKNMSDLQIIDVDVLCLFLYVIIGQDVDKNMLSNGDYSSASSKCTADTRAAAKLSCSKTQLISIVPMRHE
jgi:hypothetical protein